MESQGHFFSLQHRSKLKKNTQHDSRESNFIWDKMRTVVQETASQIALRNYSKDGQYICDFGEVGVHAIKHIFFAEGF